MKFKPLGTKICVRIEKNNKVKLGNKELEIVGSKEKESFKLFVEEIGDNVTFDVKINDEIFMFHNAYLNMHEECKKFALIDQSDIWGIIER